MVFLNWIKNLFKNRKSEEVVTNRFISDDEFNHIRAIKEIRLNKILEKINDSGLKSLSKEEIEFLENYGKN